MNYHVALANRNNTEYHFAKYLIAKYMLTPTRPDALNKKMIAEAKDYGVTLTITEEYQPVFWFDMPDHIHTFLELKYAS